MDVRSLAAWENFRRRVADLGGAVLEAEWRSAIVGHACRCPAGHLCSVTPHKLSQGHRLCTICPKPAVVLAEQKFREAVAAAGGQVVGVWAGTKAPIDVTCRAGHASRPYPSGVIQGSGFCRECAGMSPVAGERRFRELVALHGGTVVGSYAGVHASVHCICAVGHDCYPRPNDLAKGQGLCRQCGGPTAESAEREFRQRLADGDAVLLEDTYLGATAQHRIICPRNHVTTVAPITVRQKGSVYCGTCPDLRSMASERAFIIALAKHGATYVGPWAGCDQPVALICAIGHHVTTYPINMAAGKGPCRICAGKVWDALYVVRDPATGRVKFGVTSGDPRPRLGNHRKAGYTEIIRLVTGLPEGVAVLTEQKIKVALEMAGAEPVQGREYFADENVALIENEIGNWVPPIAA